MCSTKALFNKHGTICLTFIVFILFFSFLVHKFIFPVPDREQAANIAINFMEKKFNLTSSSVGSIFKSYSYNYEDLMVWIIGINDNEVLDMLNDEDKKELYKDKFVLYEVNVHPITGKVLAVYGHKANETLEELDKPKKLY